MGRFVIFLILRLVHLWSSMHQTSIFSVHFYYKHHVCLQLNCFVRDWFSSSSGTRAPQFSVLGGVYFLLGVLYKVNWCHQVWVEIFCCFWVLCVCVIGTWGLGGGSGSNWLEMQVRLCGGRMSFKAKEFLFYPVEDREPRKGFYQQGSIVVVFKNGPSADDGFEDKALRVAEEGGVCNSRGPTPVWLLQFEG